MNDLAARLDFEAKSFLDEVCEGRRTAPPAELPHESIERHAACAPDAIAVRYRDRSLTYGQLNGQANRLARHLASRGVGPESRVVVCLEPGLDIAVTLLAILKAGATYVPLDPTYPALHVRTLVEDTLPRLIIAGAPANPAFAGADLLSLEDVNAVTAEPAEEEAEENISSAIDRANTAYVYYTSGTTGKPKGVMASYANLASYVTVARERYSFSASDVMPALARFSFSISMFELLTVLSAGGTLLVLDRDHVRSPERMADTLSEVTIFHAGPSLLRPILEHVKTRPDRVAAFPSVRHASSGGDLIAPELLEAAKEVFPNAEVFVIYGCSEIACMGCTYEVPRDRRVAKTYVGRPFDGMSVRVVNEALEQVPAGEVGEICFTGNGVVKGYLNRPDPSPSKFVEIDGRRFYRTGDVGRVTLDGWIEILGRSDFQAKIRGMRVELGEVEHHLRRAPGVKDAVVVARDGADGEKVLVAYVVPNDAPRDSGKRVEVRRATELRRHMVEHLPDFMVPAIYLELSELPLNHNLKVDRRALPAPGGPASRGNREPETRTEAELASLWKKLLRVDDVQLDDNFFELGGHSLLAVRFIDEAERELGVVIDGMDVLRESLEVLARICDERLGRISEKPRPGARSTNAASRAEAFHFGNEGTLYGVLTQPARARADEAVLLCAPLAQEKVRADFVLQNLTKRLAEDGICSLKFDYYGTGDSLGDGIDATVARWRRDVADAFRELVRRTGAKRVAAVGVRLGATLLWNEAPRLDLRRLVFWDPIFDGGDHVARLEAMHRRCLEAADLSTARRRRRSEPEGHDLLGAMYSDRTIAEIRTLSMGRDSRPDARVKWLLSSPSTHAAARIEALGPGPDVTILDDGGSWEDPKRLEDMLPDTGVSAALARMIRVLA